MAPGICESFVNPAPQPLTGDAVNAKLKTDQLFCFQWGESGKEAM